MEKQEKTDG